MEPSYQVEITELVIMHYLFSDIRQTILFIHPRCSKSFVVINCSDNRVAQLNQCRNRHLPCPHLNFRIPNFSVFCEMKELNT